MVSAQQVAARYEQSAAVLDHHYAAWHRWGEVAAMRAFMAWIDSFWWDDAPPEPAALPDAVSGGQQSTVRWYDSGTAVLGYPANLQGCYQVPAADAPPALVILSSAGS